MNTLLLSAEQVRERLADLSHAQVQMLAKASGVPFTTLWKVRAGITTNPGIETVGKFMPHMPDRRDRATPTAVADKG